MERRADAPFVGVAASVTKGGPATGSPAWVSLTTDYGQRDGFVAACHGVIARIAPQVRVIDISHEIPAHDVRHGAAVLAQTVGYLPRAVHVAVVDPGVGTNRRQLAVEARDGLLVGPDNGLLLWAADALGGVTRAVELTAPQFRLVTGAHTFDGRDVFAPAAAHLARGVPLDELGPLLDPLSLVRLSTPTVEVSDGELVADVRTIDHFGNVQLAASGDDLAAASLASASRVAVTIDDRELAAAVGSAFGDVHPGELVLLVDSAGYGSLAVNIGRAADVLDVRAGSRVRLTVIR